MDRFEMAGAVQGLLNKWSNPEHEYNLDIQQEEALTAIGHAIMDGKSSGYVEMATSTGKTVVEAVLAEAAFRARKRVLLLAPSITIANQIAGQDGDSGIGKFTDLYDQADIRLHFGTRSGSPKADIVISTYQGFLRDAQAGHPQLGVFDMVIADECHRSLGEKTAAALTSSFPNAIKIGLSATPDFAIDRKSEEVYGNALYEFSLMEAIEEGRTARIRPLVYETDTRLKLMDARDEFTERELAPLINDPQRNGTAIQMTREFVSSGRQGIIRCIPGNGNVHAQSLADLLSAHKADSGRGIVAVDVGSHLPRDEQHRRLRAFNDGDIDVLTFTRTLEEGWDSDRARFCINLSPTASPVVTTQLLGRTLRRGADDTESIYVDFIDKKTGLAKNQYTALHSLGMLEADMERVLGRSRSAAHAYAASERQDFSFSPEIIRLFERSQGKSVAELGGRTATQEPINPLFAKWEKILADEGLPADISETLVLDSKIIRRRELARQALRAATGDEPTEHDVVESMRLYGLNADQKRVVGLYGIRLSLAEAGKLGTEDTPFESASQNDMLAHIATSLDMLSEQEMMVMSLQYGLGGDGPLNFVQIGQRMGVTSGRIGTISAKALAKLRNPARSDRLKGYLKPEDAISPVPIKAPSRAFTVKETDEIPMSPNAALAVATQQALLSACFNYRNHLSQSVIDRFSSEPGRLRSALDTAVSKTGVDYAGAKQSLITTYTMLLERATLNRPNSAASYSYEPLYEAMLDYLNTTP